MPSVFLSHSSRDKPFVRELAAFLGQDPPMTVWLDEGEILPGQNIVDKIRQGLDSRFIILILSPDSIDSYWVREEWTDAFWDQTNNQQTKLIPVLYRDCTIPRLLRNKKHFDLRNNHLTGFAQIKTFLLTQQPVAPKHINQLPTRPPLFIGREPELAELRRRLSEKGTLVHIAEMAGKGKTSLAKEFAHRYETDFDAVYWLPCESNNLTAIAGDLERQIGLSLGTDLDTLLRDLKHHCSQKRCLLILDNVDGEDPAKLIPGGAASVLVTTRRGDLRFLRHHSPLKLPLFTEDQCFTLFRKELGAESIDGNEAQCQKLFNRLGHLPIAVSVAAALIKEDVRYTIEGLAANLPADVKELIHDAIQALDEAPRHLLKAMAACAPEGFALSLAAEIAGFDETKALDSLQQLVARSLAEEISRTGRRYRLHALVREAADGKPLARQHFDAVHKRFENWETNWRQCVQDLPDFQLAFTWALSNSDGPLKDGPLAWLALCCYSLTARVGRPAEALEICERMAHLYEKRNKNGNLQTWLGNQALILKAWGRLDEALALHKKEEEICLALGKRDSLQICYGNQALILIDWGQFDEAVVLLKKQEEICLALGNRDSLQRSYGNQALILQAWGLLDKALALLKKKEEICLALGNQDSLQRSFGDQAIILRIWGRLDEALALLKKQEEICLALGNQDSLQRSYGNQANILQGWGRFDEALALLNKVEEICLALGSKQGLGYCYWNWGLLERALNHPQPEKEKLAAALAIFEELKMPRERDAVKAELEQTHAAGA
jgi:tetratricopeptide (TPR) repeat protein